MTTLKPCPFCGAPAHRVDNLPNKEQLAHIVGYGEDYDDGGSFIECTACQASTPLHFDRRENLESSWNQRASLQIGNLRISLFDKTPDLVCISRDGEGGVFDSHELADLIYKFVSERL